VEFFCKGVARREECRQAGEKSYAPPLRCAVGGLNPASQKKGRSAWIQDKKKETP